MEVQIITPRVADIQNELEGGLVRLTEAIDKLDASLVAHGILGGAYGYGAHWDNSVFTMRPYYWGDCDCGYNDKEYTFCETQPGHAGFCYQTELKNIEATQLKDKPWFDDKHRAEWKQMYVDLCQKHGIPYDDGRGCAVHCTCDYGQRYMKFCGDGHAEKCALELPNFLYKPNGFQVRWYKWIGRGMEFSEPDFSVLEMINHCIESLTAPDQEEMKDGKTN